VNEIDPLEKWYRSHLRVEEVEVAVRQYWDRRLEKEYVQELMDTGAGRWDWLQTFGPNHWTYMLLTITGREEFVAYTRLLEFMETPDFVKLSESKVIFGQQLLPETESAINWHHTNRDTLALMASVQFSPEIRDYVPGRVVWKEYWDQYDADDFHGYSADPFGWTRSHKVRVEDLHDIG